MLDFNKDYLTEEEKNWFGDRMSENSSGRIIVPSRLYTKFRKLVDNEFLANVDIKEWLINNCY